MTKLKVIAAITLVTFSVAACDWGSSTTTGSLARPTNTAAVRLA